MPGRDARTDVGDPYPPGVKRPERDDTDDLRAPATLEDVQAHASGQQSGQSETMLERNAETGVPATPTTSGESGPARLDVGPRLVLGSRHALICCTLARLGIEFRVSLEIFSVCSRSVSIMRPRCSDPCSVVALVRWGLILATRRVRLFRRGDVVVVVLGIRAVIGCHRLPPAGMWIGSVT